MVAIVQNRDRVQQRLQILVVEDDVLLSRLLCDALADRGHVVTPAGSAEDGLSLFDDPEIRSRGFDFLLIDIGLPGMSGIDAISAMRRLASDMRIVAMSGVPSSDVESDALEAGASRFLPKPLAMDELFAILCGD